MITGPDISSNQPHPIDWARVKGAGHTFVIVKATEGTSYANPYFDGDVRDARAAGLVTMAYHWVSPGDGAAQGSRAAAVIGQMFGKGDLVWLDYEQNGVTHAVLDATRAAIEAAGFRTGTYTYPDFWGQNGDPTCKTCGSRPLWWADYNAAHNRPAPAPWDHVALRQTDGTSVVVPGIGGLQDMSRAEVDLATLTHAPIPTPAHTEDPDMARLISEDGKAIYGTDGCRVYHVPNTAVLASLKASGVYGDGRVTTVPAGTVQSLLDAEK